MYPAAVTRQLSIAMLACLAVLMGGCTGDFESYNHVSGLRLLAIGADSPDVVQGQTATFSALVTDPAATYAWSWCPLPTPSKDGLECVVTDAELATLIDAALGANAFDAPPLDLSTGETATFTNPIGPQQGRALCAALVEFLPEGAGKPGCLGNVFPLTIKLAVTSGDGAQTVSGARKINVLLDPAAEPNTNPTFSEVTIGMVGGVSVTIRPDGSTVVARGRVYELDADAEESGSEPYLDHSRGDQPVAVREDLVFSWFTEVGEFDLGRTSYFEGERPIEQLNHNEWELPAASDDDSTSSRVWFVLRDDRGGVSWLERAVSIEGGS